MNKILAFFKELVEKLEDDFVSQEDETYCDDYMDNKVPFERVLEDRRKCVEMLANNMNSTDNNSEKELMLSLYANFYIKYGMAGRFQAEKKDDADDGLTEIFKSFSPKELYLQSVYNSVKYQDDNAWEEILDINKNSVVAKIYLFVKLCFDYCQDAKRSDEKVLDVDKYKNLWEIYESMPEIWKEYLIGEGELYIASTNHAIDENLLPHMEFISTKEILMQYIPTYYFAVLDKLGIEHDIESGFVYNEILKKLGLLSVSDYLLKEMPEKTKGISNEELIPTVADCMMEIIQRIEKCVIQFSIANEDYDMTFLTEKIHDLQFDESMDWVDSKEILEHYTFSEMFPGLRGMYLHLPVQGPIKKSLFLSQYNEYLKNRIVKRNIKQKKEMMDYYAHSWKHISYPQIVKEIAEELGDTNRRVANKLMKVYNSERTLQRGIQLLQYISSDDDSKVSKEFKNGMAKSGVDTDSVITLENVICDSLDLVVFKILMVESDDSNSIIKCREKWKSKSSLDNLREEYIEKFLDKDSSHVGILDWVNDNFFEVELIIQDEWRDVRFKEDSFSVNQFKEILVEMFTNVFLHGEGKMHLDFSNTATEMTIHEVNECNNSITGSKSGISSMERVLDYINYNTGIESLQINIEEKYEITIKISK